MAVKRKKIVTFLVDVSINRRTNIGSVKRDIRDFVNRPANWSDIKIKKMKLQRP